MNSKIIYGILGRAFGFIGGYFIGMHWSRLNTSLTYGVTLLLVAAVFLYLEVKRDKI